MIVVPYATGEACAYAGSFPENEDYRKRDGCKGNDYGRLTINR